MNAFTRLSWATWALFILSSTKTALGVEVTLERPAPTLAGESTTFDAALSDNVGETSIRWDFGDGNQTEFSTTATSAEHRYDAPGHYTVIALAKDEGGFASQSFVHTVHTAPTAIPARASTSLLLDESRNLVIAVNSDNGTVTLVDTVTLKKIAEVPVFDHPVAAALSPDGKLWVLHQNDYAIAIVDLDSKKAIDFFRLPYASQPAGIVMSPSGDAYVSLMALGEVVRIDGSSHEIVARKHVIPFARGISISGDGTSLWVTRFISQGQSGEVVRLNAETLETVASYALEEDTTTEDSDVQGRGLPNYIFSVAITPDGTRAWIPSKKDNMARGLMRDGLAITQDSAVRPLVSILDLETEQEIIEERIDLDDRNLPHHVAFTPLGDWAFISVFGSNLVEMRDTFDRSFVTALRGENLHGPVASIIDAKNRLFVLADLARMLVVYDVADISAGVDQAPLIVGEISLVAKEVLSEEVLRGKRIFANADDKRMASEGYLSCSSCHFDGFEDGRVWDFFDRGEGFRNTTSMLGRRGTGHGPLHWSANFNEIQDFDGPIRAHQGGLGFIPLEDFESGTHREPFGDPKAGLDSDLDALSAYVTSLASIPRSPYRNADGSLTDDAQAGEILFHDLGCNSCHHGEDFTDSSLGNVHDVGTMTELSGNRLGGELPGIDTPTLLGVWQTAPYLHDGSAATLRDVLTTRNIENRHGETSELTEQQLDELVSYLEQLDHGLPPVVLTLPVDVGNMPGMGGSNGTGGEADPGDPGDPETPSTPPRSASASGCSCNLSKQVNAPRTNGALWALAISLAITWARRRTRRISSTGRLR